MAISVNDNHNPRAQTNDPLDPATPVGKDDGGGGKISNRTLKVLCAFNLLLLFCAFEFGTIFGERTSGSLMPAGGGEVVAKKKTRTTTGKKSAIGDDTSSAFAVTTQEKIDRMRSAAQSLIDLLDEYYGGPDKAYSVLAGSEGWVKPWDGLRQQSPPTSNTNNKDAKLIETMMRALVDPEQRSFKIGILGSSVAAGHDNCLYDNYEKQLARTFGPVWEAAGMTLDVQNSGEGGGCGDSHRNQVWCLTQNVSPDVDIFHYVWVYFEAGERQPWARESMIRWAQMLHPRRPPVHALNVGSAKSCLSGKTESELMDHYDAFSYNGFCMRKSIYNSITNETLRGKPDRYGEDTIFQKKNVGDGLHETTRYGESETTDPMRREALGIVMRNWHPGPLGFQRVADAYSYVYSLAVLRALDRLEEGVVANKSKRKLSKSSPLAKELLDPPRMLKEDLPDPKHCEPRYCTVDAAPGCLNLELPTFGWHGASITDPDDDLNPYKGENQKWMPYKEDKGWKNHVPEMEQSIFRKNTSVCEFPDHCAGIQARSESDGRIVFKLPKMNTGMVAVCFCCGKDVGKTQLLENPHVRVELNGQELNRTEWDLYPEKKCVRLVHEGAPSMGPTGHAYLSFHLLEGNKETVRISHLITV